jgi:hypothetical protein
MGLPSSPQFQSVFRQYAEIEWHIENSKRTQSNALSATSSMQQLSHAQVAEAPSSPIFKVVQTPNIRQFPLWPTFLLPCSDLLLIPLQRPPGGTLTAPSQLPQNAPSLRRHGSQPRIPPRSGAPPATRSTIRFRIPELPAHASARARSSAGLPHSAEVCVSGDLTQRAKEREFQEARQFLDAFKWIAHPLPSNASLGIASTTLSSPP